MIRANSAKELVARCKEMEYEAKKKVSEQWVEDIVCKEIRNAASTGKSSMLICFPERVNQDMVVDYIREHGYTVEITAHKNLRISW